MLNHRYLLAIIVLIAVASVGFVFLYNNDFLTTRSNNQTLSLATGKNLYEENCASCHGDNLEGELNWQQKNSDGTLPAPPHDATGHTWHHDDLMLFQYTKLGGAGYANLLGVSNFKSAMPAFEDILDDEEIISVLNYIKSTWPQEIRDIQSARNN